MPPADRLPDRLDAVLRVLYLVFNEGYDASGGEALIRRELCAEAIRLARVVAELLPDEPEALGLLALMLLTTPAGRPATAPTASSCARGPGPRPLGRGARSPRARRSWSARCGSGASGPYQLQAAIAAVHDEAPSTDETDWVQILGLYEVLVRVAPSPVVVPQPRRGPGPGRGLRAGLAAVDTLAGDPAMAGLPVLPRGTRRLPSAPRALGRVDRRLRARPRAHDERARSAAFLEGRQAEIRRPATAG